MALARRPGALAGFAIWMAVLTAGYVMLPALRPVGYGLLGVSAVITILASATANRRALAREHELRLAGGALAAAGSVADVAHAVTAAVPALAGPHLTRPAVVAVREGGEFRQAGAGPDGTSPPAGQVAALLAPWLDRLTSSGPQLVTGETGAGTALLCPLLPVGRSAGGGGADGSAPAGLSPDGGGRDTSAPAGLSPGGGGTDSSPPAGPSPDRSPPDGAVLGVLAVFGEHRHLARLSGTLEILAAQAASAVERIERSREVSRRDRDAYFRALVQDTSDAIVILEEDERIRYATPSAGALFGDVVLAGQRLADVVPRAERDGIVAAFRRLRDHAAEGARAGLRITRTDGTGAEVEARCSDLRLDPAVGGLVYTLRDVTEQRALERELKHRAFHDALTGLPNRVRFSDRIAQGLARSRRARTTMGVLLVDLDDFKVVNDTMGHGIGDELLAAAGKRLSALARSTDTVARIGGDEFGLLVESGDSSAVDRIADRIIGVFAEPFLLTEGSVLVTATVGVATTEDSSDAGDLVRHADLALYAAKSAGKRQWRRYQPVLSVGVAKRRELRAAMDEAIQASAFTLVYQPIVALSRDEVVGFEALLRWPHPRWGMLHPDQFITLAEETGHIIPLGSWVLRQAVADIVRLQRRLPRDPPLYVSVNVSARQFASPGFAAEVRRVVSASGLAPSALVLELTESVLLHREDRIRADLTELKNIGIRLAIDDFGTGYSSLGYLRELPMDILKIDRSFVEGMAVSQQRLAIVEIIIRIARTLGMAVIAEGIESEVQRELLLSLGCEYGQGYLLERPAPAGEAEAIVRARSMARLGAVTS